MTNSEKAIAQLFGVLCAVIKSEHTPQMTKQATINTFSQLIGDENSPFLSDELNQLSAARILEKNVMNEQQSLLLSMDSQM